MKIPAILNFIVFSICTNSISFANQDCPKLNTKYSFKSSSPAVEDLGKLSNINLINIKSGEVEIIGDASNKISFLWNNENGEIISGAANELKFNKDYKCKDGWIIFSLKTPSSRNYLPGLYMGESNIRLSIDDLYYGLKIESTFKGREDITLFSYDSAHVSFLKWWGRKTLVDTVVLNTAPTNQKNINTESESLSKVRKMFSEKVLGGILLVGLDERADNFLITLRSLRLSDLETFENRLTSASIPYKWKTEPIWTNNSYFLELIVAK